MPNGSGVSIGEVKGGRWRVRWRETDAEGTSTQRERTRATLVTAQLLQADVIRQLETQGHYKDPAAPAPVRTTTLDAIGRGWNEARVARGLAPTTVRSGISGVASILRHVRALEKVPPTVPVSAELLSRDLVVRVTNALRAEGKAEETVYHTIGAMLDMWGWAADDPQIYPGVPVPPRDRSRVMPEKEIPFAPPPPTIGELDAVIRALKSEPRSRRVALPSAVIMRWTGLRISQVLGIRVTDVFPNIEHPFVLVRVGKSRREKAERREIPIAQELADYLLPLWEEAKRRGTVTLISQTSGKPATPPSRAITTAWKKAIAAKEARVEVWKPEDRKKARPDHAFRAGLQGHLVEAGVREETLDALVGHASRTVRGRHYAGADARMKAMREAVALLPPVAWIKPSA